MAREVYGPMTVRLVFDAATWEHGSYEIVQEAAPAPPPEEPPAPPPGGSGPPGPSPPLEEPELP